MASTKTRILLKNVRISYANLFKPKAYNEGAPKFSGSFLIPKDSEQVMAVKKAIIELVQRHWPTNAPKIPSNKQPLRDGDDVEWEGYADHFFISASNMLQPMIKDLDGSNLLAGGPLSPGFGEKPQSGDYVNVALDLVIQDNEFGKRVNAYLMGVQFVREGQRFGGGMDDDMFASTTVAKPQSQIDKEKRAEEEEGMSLFGDN